MGGKGGYDEEDDQQQEEDEEEEYEDEEGEEDEDRSHKRKRGSQFFDEVAEEDEDEEEEEEDYGGKKGKKKASSYRRSAFIDDVAAVASDDEEEEEEEEDGFIDRDTDIPEDVGRHAAPHRTLLPRDEEEGEMDEEEYQRMLEERYARASEGAAMDDVEATDVERQALLPSVRDPKLWMVKCKIGSEREAVVSLMQKFVNLDLEGKANTIAIKSAVALDSLKGMVYVEADRESHVKDACRGIRLLYSWKPVLVPIKEMAGVLTVQAKQVELDVNAWVRVKIGVYKGDLAQVVDVDTVRQRATIKLIPRIDLQAVEARQNGEPIPKRKSRPPPRFFHLEEARSKGVKMIESRNRTTGDMVLTVDGNSALQFLNGYQLKVVSLKSLETSGVVPTLDELQQFQGSNDDANDGHRGGGGGMGADGNPLLGLSPAMANKQRSRLVKGDIVEVIEGDLKGLKGRVEKVEDDEIVLRPQHAELKDPLPVKESQVRKYFRTGDHVKVIAGQHEGDTGMIVKVDGHIAVLLSDTSKEHVKVFSRDLISSSEVTSGPAQLGQYELHDLVQLDQTMTGVIIKIETAGCVVLKSVPEKAELITVKLRDIRRRATNIHVKATDMDGRAIMCKDPVRVQEGLYKGRQGSAEHITRGLVFVYDRNLVENSGFFCVRARHCRVLSGAGRGSDPFTKPAPRQPFDPFGRGGGPGGYLRSPSHMLRSPRNVPSSPGRGYGRGGTGGPGSYGGGRHGFRSGHGSLIGRFVKIRSGPYKGYRGRVLDATDTNARIELESMMKVVTVRRDQLPDDTMEGAMTPAAPSQQGTPAPYRESPYTSRRIGSETPMHPSRTPMHSGFGGRSDPTATPIHEGMRTPMRDRAWNPHVPATPLRSDSYDSANPATWGSNSHGLGQAASAYVPYTPALSPPDSAAASPPILDAGTPGARSYDVPTPGSSAPSTYNPTTPYGDASTPYSDAPTPNTATHQQHHHQQHQQHQQPLTPGAAPSPYGGGPMTAASPYMPPTTPGGDGMLPMTPGGGDIGSGGGFGSSENAIGLPGVWVRVTQAGSEPVDVVIRELLPDGSCRVGQPSAGEDELFVAAPRAIEIMAPRKHERVKVLSGKHKGATGKLIGIDAGEGIVKIDNSPEVEIVDMALLGKLAG